MASTTSTTGDGAASRRWGGGKVSGKQLVMAGMIGTLALVAVVCSVSVVLSPAHIIFAARVRENKASNGTINNITITIVANNTSKHAKVQYRSMKTEVWLSDAQWVPVDFDNKSSANFRYQWWQPPANSTFFRAQVKPVEEEENKPKDSGQGGNGCSPAGTGGPRGNDDKKEYTVVIKTQVQFRYGPARTRLYNILVTCPSINISRTDHDYDDYDYDDYGYDIDSINDACT